MDSSRAIVIGAVTLSIAVLIVGYIVKPARYQITRISEGMLVRFDTVTGQTDVCALTKVKGERYKLAAPLIYLSLPQFTPGLMHCATRASRVLGCQELMKSACSV